MAGLTLFRPGAPRGAIDVIAHRGASDEAPENTMAAFERAIEVGADWIELDCALTRDEQAVVIHDDTLDRTTTGSGPVYAQTLADIQKLDAGAWKDEAFAGQRVPAIEEVLDRAKDTIGLYIELKNNDPDQSLQETVAGFIRSRPEMTPRCMQQLTEIILRNESIDIRLTKAVIDQLDKRRMKSQVTIQSFSPIICAAVVGIDPAIRVELLGKPELTPQAWDNFRRWAEIASAWGCNIEKSVLTPERISQLHGDEKTIAVWTVDAFENIRRFADWGVDAIITNKPKDCLNTLKEMGKR